MPSAIQEPLPPTQPTALAVIEWRLAPAHAADAKFAEDREWTTHTDDAGTPTIVPCDQAATQCEPGLFEFRIAPKAMQETLDQRLQQHTPFVWQLAGRASAQWGVPFEDLAQEGFIGICIAHKRFTLDHGASFLTYASWWIRQRINRYALCNTSLIRPPESGFRAGRAPILGCVSLNDKARDCAHDNRNWALELEDPAAPPTHNACFADTLARHLAALSDEQRQVLELHYLQDIPIPEIALRLGITQQAVRQHRYKALRRLRRRIAESETLSAHTLRPLKSRI
jgi:RNA polymerase sigma factor (sigma-70 family)